MNGNFKKCQRGHYYNASLTSCPYCPGAAPATGASAEVTSLQGETSDTMDSNKTLDFSSMTQGVSGTASQGSGATETFGFGINSLTGDETIAPGATNHAPVVDNHTMIFDDSASLDAGNLSAPRVRSTRKLVGWLVSYTLDDMGVDYKLYEGRNIIGRNIDCQIAISDSTVSGEHATLLFRAGRYSLRDNQSTQGTFVNGEDIELEPCYLNDGDMIRIGQTIFKFRSSL